MAPSAPAPHLLPLLPLLPISHRRRLHDVYRSAGWPCLDAVEIELLAAGLLERVRQPAGHETLRVSDAGVALLASALRRNRARRDAHEALVERVAREMTRAGRIAWRGLSVRAKVTDAGVAGEPGGGGRWGMAMPDVFSIRQTSVEAYLQPVVHEVKVRRSDLLADLRNPAKRAAYLQLGSECWYVLRAGIARADEVPPECGVLFATDTALDVARPAPRRAMHLPFDLWMALARAAPLPGWRLEDSQGLLGDTDQTEEP